MPSKRFFFLTRARKAAYQSFSQPASESDIQLLRYQNRQLANALQERKEEIVLLSSKLRSLTSKQSLYDNSLGFVARNWDSVRTL